MVLPFVPGDAGACAGAATGGRRPSRRPRPARPRGSVDHEQRDSRAAGRRDQVRAGRIGQDRRRPRRRPPAPRSGRRGCEARQRRVQVARAHAGGSRGSRPSPASGGPPTAARAASRRSPPVPLVPSGRSVTGSPLGGDRGRLRARRRDLQLLQGVGHHGLEHRPAEHAAVVPVPGVLQHTCTTTAGSSAGAKPTKEAV